MTQLDTFVHELAEVVTNVEDHKILADTVSDMMRRLLAGPFFLGDERTRPAAGGINARVLHLDPRKRFVITSCAWGPQQGTPIHDHESWGVIGAVQNRVILTSYRRNDDATIPGFADVSEVGRVLVSETSLACLRAPDELISKIENPFRDPAVTLNVFGDVRPWQHTFDPPAKTVTPLTGADGTVGV